MLLLYGAYKLAPFAASFADAVERCIAVQGAELQFHGVAAQHPHEGSALLQVPKGILAHGVRQRPDKVNIEQIVEALPACRRSSFTGRLCQQNGVAVDSNASSGSSKQHHTGSSMVSCRPMVDRAGWP